MRIIKNLVAFFLALALIAGVGFVTVREALLTWAVWGVQDSVALLHNSGQNQQQFTESCRQFKVTNSQRSQVKSLELAFTDNRHYQLQVICQDYIYQPVVLKNYELRPLVTKLPGSAGWVWSKTTPTTVTLELWGRTQSITLRPDKTQVTQGQLLLDSTLAPQAACQAYGFQCCATDATQGFGVVATEATDCPQTCFAQCLLKPVILSFNTQPFFDPKDRSISVLSGQEIGFSYTTNLAPAKVKSVILEFGDAQVYQSASPSGSVNHTYFCNEATCEYQARLNVTDTQDLSNALTPVSQVKIIVVP